MALVSRGGWARSRNPCDLCLTPPTLIAMHEVISSLLTHDPVPAPVVLSAHLDTVFGPDVDVSVERRGRRLEGPGISDNARGIAALVAVAEAVVTARVRTARPILFAATVGEEGSGDLRGVKY